MLMYFATWMEAGQADALTLKEARQRLLSYHFIRAASPGLNFISAYTSTGLIPKKVVPKTKKKTKRKRRV